MNTQNLNTINAVNITGTLVDVVVKEGVSAKGADYVSAALKVKVATDRGEQVLECRAFSRKLKADKTVNKLFEQYIALPQLLNKRVDIVGSLGDNMFVTNDTLRHSVQIDARFISAARGNNPDSATFEIGGFLQSRVVEKTNQAGEIYRYDITLGQTDYKGTKANLFTLSLDKDNLQAVQYIEGLDLGTTMNFAGEISYRIEKTVKEVESAFGNAPAKVYENTFREYFITSGRPEVELIYTAEDITELMAGTKAAEAQKMTESKDKPSAQKASSSTDQSAFGATVPPKPPISIL